MKNIIAILTALLPICTSAQWYQVSTPTTENLNHIQFVDNQVGYCGGDNGTLLKSTDGGNTWSLLNTSFSTENIQELYFKDTDNGIITTDSNIYITADAGNTFQSLAVFNQLKDSLTDYKVIKLNLNCKNNVAIIYTALVSINNAASVITKSYKSNNFASTWVEISPIPGNQGFVKIVDSLTWFSNYFSMYKTLDGGQNWLVSDSAQTGFPPLSNHSWHVFDSSGKSIVGTSYHYDLYLLQRFDTFCQYYGKIGWGCNIKPMNNLVAISYIISKNTYIEVYSDIFSSTLLYTDTIPSLLVSFETIGNNKAWLCGHGGKIYKNDNILLSSNFPSESEFKIFPNPSKDILKIENPGRINIEKIQVTNLSGQVIKAYISNFDELDVSEISLGHYILSIITDQGQLNKKVLIK